jgi:hypothetical protein
MTLLTRSRKSPKLTFEVVIVVDDFFSNKEDRQDNFIPQRYQRRDAPTRVNSGTLSVSVTGWSLEYHAKIAWRTITSSFVGLPSVIKRARCDTSCVRRWPSFSFCACFQSVVYERSLFKRDKAWKCVSETRTKRHHTCRVQNMWILTEGEDCLPFQ